MFVMAITVFNYGLILIYGSLLSVDISVGKCDKKEKLLAVAITAALLLADGVVYFTAGMEATEQYYPFITHIPLILALFLILKRPFLISIASVLIAYLCCQIPNWFGLLAESFSSSAVVSELCYTAAIFVSFALLHRFIVKPANEALHASKGTLFFLAILPAIYYVFDYLTTVYTKALYEGIPAVEEFTPTITVLFYVILVSIYHRWLKKKYAMELETSVLTMELKQSDIELSVLQKSLEETAAYRHDMRHHFMILGEYLKDGDNEKALAYIHSAQKEIDHLTPKQYCKNKSINLILSYYETLAQKSTVRYDVSVSIPTMLTLPETELCTLLSNGIENALHAAAACRADARWIAIDLHMHKSNLLISIQNSFIDTVHIEDGLPVTDAPNHGLGVKSIRNIADRHNGMCSFDASDGIFTMRVILRQ